MQAVPSVLYPVFERLPQAAVKRRVAGVRTGVLRGAGLALVCAVLHVLGLLGGGTLRAEVAVSATLQPATTNVGEPVQLNITVTGSQRVDQIPNVRVEGAQVQHIGQNTQIQLINANLTVSLTNRFLVSPSKIGELEIPPVDVVVEGKHYSTQALKLRVLDVGQDASGTNAAASAVPAPTAEVELPKRPVYVGESFPVEVRLVVPSEIRWRIERMPEFETDAFTKTAFLQPQQRQQNRAGRDFDVCMFRTTLTAIKSGQVPLGPLTFNIQAAAAKAKTNNAANPFGGFFDGFPFGSQPTVLQERKVILEQQMVDIRELPADDKPASFRGAIGRFRFSAAAGQSKVKAGEPLVMTLQVEGEGNFDRIEAPPLVEPEGWRAYPAEASFAKADDTGLRGVKTFRIALVPEKNFSRTPQFEFASFDPDAGTYQKQQNGVSPFVVEGLPSPEPEAKTAAPAAPKPVEKAPEPKPEPKPILAQTLTRAPETSPFWDSLVSFKLAQAAAWAALAAVAGSLGFATLRRNRGPAPALLKEARTLEASLAGQSGRAGFYAKAVRSVQLRVEARTGQPAAAVGPAEAARAFGADAALEGDLRWLFEADAEQRFAGGAASEASLKQEERGRVKALLGKLV